MTMCLDQILDINICNVEERKVKENEQYNYKVTSSTRNKQQTKTYLVSISHRGLLLLRPGILVYEWVKVVVPPLTTLLSTPPMYIIIYYYMLGDWAPRPYAVLGNEYANGFIFISGPYSSPKIHVVNTRVTSNIFKGHRIVSPTKN